MNYETERTLFNNIELKLFKLEDAIQHQIENNWSQPGIVIAKLEGALNGIDATVAFGGLSRKESELLFHFHSNLLPYQKYPLETLDDFEELSDEDRKDFLKNYGKSL